jgi:hypothetical protein
MSSNENHVISHVTFVNSLFELYFHSKFDPKVSSNCYMARCSALDYSHSGWFALLIAGSTTKKDAVLTTNTLYYTPIGESELPWGTEEPKLNGHVEVWQ